MEQIEIIRAGADYRSRHRDVLRDVSNTPVADLGLAPALLVRLAVEELHQAGPAPDDRHRLEVIARAGRAFAEDTLGDESPDAYCRKQARLSGVPVRAARRTLATVARATAELPTALQGQRPPATLRDGASWARRGRSLAVHAPGNHPLPHLEWLPALALGFKIALRPSRRDPYTPRRLMRALLGAGLDPTALAFLPTDHACANSLTRHADLGLVYGGPDVVAAHAADPTVRVQGPGRSKILLTADVDWADHIDLLAESVAADGGVQCLNTTLILAEEGTDHRALAHALAERLAQLPDLPPEHPDAALPARPLTEAQAVANRLQSLAGTELLTPRSELVTDLADGSALLRPAVSCVSEPDGVRRAVEFPFPCVWVAPWHRPAGLAPLTDTLALTLLSHDGDLATQCAAAPSIRTVHLGPQPTTAYQTQLPHDGYLSGFLMEARTFAQHWVPSQPGLRTEVPA
ncbi:aldehyde dehydrogenase family protein [Streptomyces enissocaesilis]|uniref:Aldehyde dehydrogenase family protein n=1 Tax=Streptomyces enissocaesilis TaxID=332589 RepID=A0ABN3X656_9ACTN